jgi:spore maturation protein CgeB
LKFTDFDELLKKLKFYMSESGELEKVTNAGYKRVIKDNRNYKEQLTFILNQLNKSF